MGADPEDADEDAHDRAVILLILRRTLQQIEPWFRACIGVFTSTEAHDMFI